jgi:hypothetical protein
MVDRWLEDSGISFGCEEVGPIDVVDRLRYEKLGLSLSSVLKTRPPLIVLTLYLPSIHAG